MKKLNRFHDVSSLLKQTIKYNKRAEKKCYKQISLMYIFRNWATFSKRTLCNQIHTRKLKSIKLVLNNVESFNGYAFGIVGSPLQRTFVSFLNSFVNHCATHAFSFNSTLWNKSFLCEERMHTICTF